MSGERGGRGDSRLVARRVGVAGQIEIAIFSQCAVRM